MPDRIVADSSVIAALFFREDGVCEKAEKAIMESRSIYTLDIAIAEITNVAWKKVRIQGEDREVVEHALRKCMEFIRSVCTVVSSAELFDTAFRIAVERGITAYDALFASASEKYNAHLITADRKLAESVENSVLVR